jgi:hypothetical protein
MHRISPNETSIIITGRLDLNVGSEPQLCQLGHVAGQIKLFDGWNKGWRDVNFDVTTDGRHVIKHGIHRVVGRMQSFIIDGRGTLYWFLYRPGLHVGPVELCFREFPPAPPTTTPQGPENMRASDDRPQMGQASGSGQ